MSGSAFSHRAARGRGTALAQRPLLPAVLFGVGLALLAALPARAVYDRFTAPPPPNITAAAGKPGSATLHVTTSRVPGRLDLIDVLDLSSSYSDDLGNMRALLPALSQRIAKQADLRVGLVTFVDDPCCGGDGGDLPVDLVLPPTADIAELDRSLTSLRPGSGGDGPESWSYAIDRMLAAFTLRPDAVRVLILATDDNSHAVGDGSGSSAPTAAALGRRLADAGVRVVAIVPDGAAPEMVKALVSATGGSLQAGDRASADIDDTILRGLGSVPVDVTPSMAGACPLSDVIFSPPALNDVPGGATLDLGVRYTVGETVAPGRYSCAVDLGEGGSAIITVEVR